MWELSMTFCFSIAKNHLLADLNPWADTILES